MINSSKKDKHFDETNCGGCYNIGRPSEQIYKSCRLRQLTKKHKWLKAEQNLLDYVGFVELGPVNILRTRMEAYHKNLEIQRANKRIPVDDGKVITQVREIRWYAALVPLALLVIIEFLSINSPIRESASAMYHWFSGIDFINNLASW